MPVIRLKLEASSVDLRDSAAKANLLQKVSLHNPGWKFSACSALRQLLGSSWELLKAEKCSEFKVKHQERF